MLISSIFLLFFSYKLLILYPLFSNSEKKANMPARITLTYNVELKVQASEIRQENKKGNRLKKKQLP